MRACCSESTATGQPHTQPQKNKHKDNHTKETNLLNALDGEQIGTGAKGADQGGQNASIDVVLLQARQNLIESAMVAKQVDEVNLRTRGNGRG